MSALTDRHLEGFLEVWKVAPSLPLEVYRSRYEDPMPRSWEVMAYETPTFSVPIAEFTEWAEAQKWADEMSRWAASRGTEVRRFKYGHWPSGEWGGIGYYDHTETYHELPDPNREAETPTEVTP